MKVPPTIEEIDIQYSNEIQASCFGKDVEMNHSNADDIIIHLLKSLGYNSTVKKYKSVKKWYS